jgi:hypothetical protein
MATGRRTSGYGIFILLSCALVFGHVGATAIYLRGDLNIGQKDVAAHLKICTKYYLQMRDLIRHESSPWTLLKKTVMLFHQKSMGEEHIWLWPRLVYAVTAPAASLFGLTPRVIIFSNAVWLALLILSIYGIGSRGMSPAAGLISAVAVSFFPATYGLSRNYGLDFPLMAVTALNIYWLMRTERFSRRGASAVFGCTMALGLLVKLQIVIFMCAPIAVALAGGVATALHAGSARRKAVSGLAAHLLLAAFLAAALSSIHWWGNVENTVNIFIKHSAKIEEFGNVDVDTRHLAASVLSPEYFAYYLVAAIVYVSPVYCALCLILLPTFLRSRFAGKGIILAWSVGSYALWTMIQFKWDVYCFPFLPACALIIGAGIASLRRTGVRIILVAVCVAWGLLHYLNLSFPIGPPPYRDCRLYASECVRADGYPVWARPPLENTIEDIAGKFMDIVNAQESGNGYLRVGILEYDYSAEDYVLVDCLEYLMEARNPAMYVYRSFFSPDSFLECMDSFNFIIVLEKGNRGVPGFKAFEDYFTEGQGTALTFRYIQSREIFLNIAGGYGTYETMARGYIVPEGVTAFLMRKPPFPVGADTAMPATRLVGANVYIAYPYIGMDESLRHAPTIGDYDVLFPYDVDFPLVTPGRRNPAEGYYSRYRVRFEEGGNYALSTLLKKPSVAPLRAVVNGRPVVGGRTAGGGADAGDSRLLGTFTVPAGESEVDLRGGEGFPVVRMLHFRRTSPR